MRNALNTAADILKTFFLHLPLSRIIDELFKYEPSDSQTFLIRKSPSDLIISTSRFIPYLQNMELEYSIEELTCRVGKLMKEIDSEPGQIPIRRLVFFFANYMINRYHEQYRFAYKYCDIWRKAALPIDEDIFVIAKIIQENRRRCIGSQSDFSWPYCIEHDNLTISKILTSGEGVSDNHFHLRCSSPYYHFSWIHMMSNPASDKYTDMIREIERQKLYAGIKLEAVDADESLSVLWIKAAAIRLYLFRQLCVMNNKMLPQKTDEDISIIVPRILRSKTITLFHSNKLQEIIQNLRFFCRKPEQLDYISSVKTDGGFLYDLYGERYLLTEILQRNKSREIETLLFLYLAIKNHFRSELVQCNSLIGFDNFSKYQSRKDWFLDDDDQMEMRLASATISSVLCGPKIHSLEMRITPSLSNSEDVSPAMLNIRKIRGYDKAIMRVLDRSDFDYTIDRFYYTMHFPKETESLGECNVYFCRHHRLREKNEIRAEGLLGMQEIAPEVALRVRGIDACSKEIECRPEVFGPVFRKLQYYNKDHELPQFQVTYHVAEHNYDIVDGLRAIHEAIIFLGLRSGSRLGHATFLGIPADQFYAGKGMSISMPLQNYIDNLVWMYFFMLKNLEAFPKAQIVLDFIRSKYCEHIHTLFGDQADSSTLPSIEEYNLAWLLRGDEPSLYQDSDPDKWRQPHSYDSYMLCNSVPEIGQARKSKKIRHFYHMYHYDKNIRRNGCTSVCETVTSEIVEIIGNIQNAMKKMISKKEISIECNPSSNLFISPIQGYHQHPIHILFDKGLTVRSFQKTQLNVSVNTDDQSVFSTSISNEYAYLAFSLESETNGTSYSAADIYEWIELLKRNGNAQSFLNIGFVPNKTMQALLKEEPGERRR